MARHREDLLAVVEGSVLLRRAQVRAAAERILAEPRLTRPVPGGEGDLNARLPLRYFELQDELLVRTRAVLESDGQEALSRRLGELTATCMACHALYLDP